MNPSPTAEAHLQQGLDLLAAGSPAEAARAFRHAIASDGNLIEAHHGLIRALRDAGRLDEAVAAAEALADMTPDDALAYTALSLALQQAGRIPQAESAAARARIMEWKAVLQSPPEEEQK